MMRILAAMLAFIACALAGLAIAGPLTTMGAGGFTAAGGVSYLLQEDGTSKFLLEDEVQTLTYDTASTQNGAAPASLSWSHTTTTNSNRLMLAGCSWRGTGSMTGVTYNSVGLTSVGSASGANNTKMQMWRLFGPATGANTALASFTGSIDGAVCGAFTFWNAHQSTLGTFASNTGTGGTATVDCTSATGEIVVDTLSWDRGTAVTAGGGQTERWDADDAGDGDVRGAGSTEAGATTTTMSWTGGGAEAWAIGCIAAKPSSAPSSFAILLE